MAADDAGTPTEVQTRRFKDLVKEAVRELAKEEADSRKTGSGDKAPPADDKKQKSESIFAFFGL